MPPLHLRAALTMSYYWTTPRMMGECGWLGLRVMVTQYPAYLLCGGSNPTFHRPTCLLVVMVSHAFAAIRVGPTTATSAGSVPQTFYHTNQYLSNNVEKCHIRCTANNVKRANIHKEKWPARICPSKPLYLYVPRLSVRGYTAICVLLQDSKAA